MRRDGGEPTSSRVKVGLEAAVTATGLVFLTAALLANQAWWDRHFLPLFFYSHEKFVRVESLARLAAGLVGSLLILFVRPLLGRMASRMPGHEIAAGALRILLAIALALLVTEWMRGHKFVYAAAEMQPGEKPVRQPDQRLGWVFRPSQDASIIAGGRPVAYSIDSLGYRVPSHDAPIDVNAPSILFTGESVIAGYGLNWSETIPAQVATALKTQSATIAVFGYANDQAYLRLASELPRFRQPVAVVSLFIPSLFARNLGDDRPHLDAGLHWRPAVHRSWLSALFRFLVPYHSETEIEQGIAATRAELIATAALARRHGAISLVVDPQYDPESAVEQMLRRRVLEQSGIDYVQVPLDPSWHLKGDLHPDLRAAQAIAVAVSARLKTDLEQSSQRVSGRQAARSVP